METDFSDWTFSKFVYEIINENEFCIGRKPPPDAYLWRLLREVWARYPEECDAYKMEKAP